MEDLQFFSVDPSFACETEVLKTQCRSLLQQSFIRGDYKELIQIVLFYIGDETQERLQFHKPGALHSARWMAKLLYSIKLVMLAPMILSQLPKGAVFGAGQLDRIKRFVAFIVLCYVPWWLTAPVTAYAPTNDLAFITRVRRYASVDEASSSSALTAFNRHLWYLTQELVPLTLFCRSVDDTVKEAIVKKLQGCQRNPNLIHRFGFSWGKPSFPDLSNETALTMASFIGEDSWKFFDIVKVDTAFLELPVSDWCNDADYLRAKEVIDSLSVVNDAAERGVKLSSDFLCTTTSEEMYANVLQVVEDCRKKIPNQRKIRKYKSL